MTNPVRGTSYNATLPTVNGSYSANYPLEDEGSAFSGGFIPTVAAGTLVAGGLGINAYVGARTDFAKEQFGKAFDAEKQRYLLQHPEMPVAPNSEPAPAPVNAEPPVAQALTPQQKTEMRTKAAHSATAKYLRGHMTNGAPTFNPVEVESLEGAAPQKIMKALQERGHSPDAKTFVKFIEDERSMARNNLPVQAQVAAAEPIAKPAAATATATTTAKPEVATTPPPAPTATTTGATAPTELTPEVTRQLNTKVLNDQLKLTGENVYTVDKLFNAEGKPTEAFTKATKDFRSNVLADDALNPAGKRYGMGWNGAGSKIATVLAVGATLGTGIGLWNASQTNGRNEEKLAALREQELSQTPSLPSIAQQQLIARDFADNGMRDGSVG